jgi:hypothetical protein
MKRLGGGESLSFCKHTHTFGRQQVLQKNSGEDPSCQPLSAPIDVNVKWSLSPLVDVNVERSLSALVDVNVEQSPRHIMNVNSS